MTKRDKQEEARALRRKGKAVREIAEEIGCSKGSVSRWVRDVKLTESQQKYLDSLNPAKNKALRGPGAADTNRLVWYERRKQYQEEGRQLARKGDRDFVAGIMLYWAEGAKDKNQVNFCNTELAMVKFFVDFLKKYMGVTDQELSVRIGCHTDNGITLQDIEEHWLGALGLNRSNLNKTHIESKRKVTGYRKKRHPYGVCTIRVNNTAVLQRIYGAIQEYIGFTEPQWVG